MEGFMMSKKLENVKGIYLEGIKEGKVREAVTKYTGERYTQHSTGVRDGVEGFVEFFMPFIERNPQRDIIIERALVDGQYVFVHAYQSLNNGEAQWITTDFFDTNKKDKIIEHWDVIGEYQKQTPSGHTSFDGETEIMDMDKTERNKNIVRRFMEEVRICNRLENIETYISSDSYIEHNKDAKDGIVNFKKKMMQVVDIIKYKDLFLLVGQGNFVATLSRAYRNVEELAQVDVFRLEDDFIVEHWDNCEMVAPVDKWRNSGKF